MRQPSEGTIREILQVLLKGDVNLPGIAELCQLTEGTVKRHLAWICSEGLAVRVDFEEPLWSLTSAGRAWLRKHKASAATPPEAHRRRQLAIIHMAKVELRLSEDQYRDLVYQVGGVESAAALDLSGLNRLIQHFTDLGFQVRVPAAKGVKLSPPSRNKQFKEGADKIRALWIELGKTGALRDPSEEGLRRFVARLTGNDRLEWLRVEQASKAIEALKSWLERAKRERNGKGK